MQRVGLMVCSELVVDSRRGIDVIYMIHHHIDHYLGEIGLSDVIMIALGVVVVLELMG